MSKAKIKQQDDWHSVKLLAKIAFYVWFSLLLIVNSLAVGYLAWVIHIFDKIRG